ncbi:hypothetical protein LWI29_013173 [Acer saccharum]|uniref:Uncharacterized protein n=1 Tax=Acer saccharum TaxID=4024 RepID=A0AA39VQM2_ACESA|nr:hypothetical protein LWI29_013173 [Acer saccharum]
MSSHTRNMQNSEVKLAWIKSQCIVQFLTIVVLLLSVVSLVFESNESFLKFLSLDASIIEYSIKVSKCRQM